MSHPRSSTILIALALLYSLGSLYALGEFSIKLEDSNIRDAVEAISAQTGIPACLEFQDLDPKIDGVTVEEKLSNLAAKNQNLSPREQQLLTMLPALAESDPKALIDWKIPRFTKTITGAGEEELVRQLEEMYGDYEFVFDNTYFVIFPRQDSVLSIKVPSIDAPDADLGKVMKLLSSVLSENGISFGFQLPPGKDPVDLRELKTSPLRLNDLTLREALTRICQSAEKPLVWSLGGMKGARLLNLSLAVSR